MGIGVKYYSGNIRKSFNVEGVPPAGSDLDGFVRHSKMLAENGLKGFIGRGKSNTLKSMPNVADLPGLSGEKLCGSLVESLNGKICLSGEENETQPDGRRVYGAVNGQRGWHKINDIDSPVSCVRVGPEAGYCDVEADTSTRNVNENTGFELSVDSRVVLAEIDMAGIPNQAVYSFSRTLRFTPGGRLFEIGPEKRQLIGIVSFARDRIQEWSCSPTFDEESGELTGLTFKKAGEKDEDAHVVPVEPCDS